LEPNVRLCALGSGTLSGSTLASITNTGARIVAWEQSTVASNEIALVHNTGLSLFVWTVDGPAIERFIDLGVDGIISDDPGMVKTLREAGTNTFGKLGDQLVSYWKMDDGLTNAFSTTVADSTGTNSATLVRNDGASHWFAGGTARFGGCLKLEGTKRVRDPATNRQLEHQYERPHVLGLGLAAYPSLAVQRELWFDL
jgi:hypothetical protein